MSLGCADLHIEGKCLPQVLDKRSGANRAIDRQGFLSAVDDPPCQPEVYKTDDMVGVEVREEDAVEVRCRDIELV